MIISVAGQRAIEAKAVEKGISLLQLMESAGQKSFSHLRNHYQIKDAVVPVLAGNGGNGGDGFVVARLLKQAGAHPIVVLCSGTPKANAPSLMYRRAVSDGVPVVDVVLEWDRIRETIAKCDLVVDAVYGIGFHGELNESMSKLFFEANQSKAAVIALDMPSGVNADNGQAASNAIEADETIGFVANKLAYVLKAANRYCGKVVLEEIGIPSECYIGVDQPVLEINRELVSKILSPKPEYGHKGDFGRLLLAVGSDRYRGAASLAAKGAYYAGAGMVTVASTEKALSAVAAHVPEAILLDLSENASEYAIQLERADACLIGCGMAISKTSTALLEATLNNAGCPLVIDADGLNILAKNPGFLDGKKSEVILTPHIGEFSRLSGIPVEEVLADRIKAARDYAVKVGSVVVLKSENTVVAVPGGKTYINTIGNSGLAKAGSGDLLSGMIAALLGRGMTSTEAAIAGVYLHSLAADIAARHHDLFSMTASAVAQHISDAYQEVFLNQKS